METLEQKISNISFIDTNYVIGGKEVKLRLFFPKERTESRALNCPEGRKYLFNSMDNYDVIGIYNNRAENLEDIKYYYRFVEQADLFESDKKKLNKAAFLYTTNCHNLISMAEPDKYTYVCATKKNRGKIKEVYIVLYSLTDKIYDKIVEEIESEIKREIDRTNNSEVIYRFFNIATNNYNYGIKKKYENEELANMLRQFYNETILASYWRADKDLIKEKQEKILNGETVIDKYNYYYDVYEKEFAETPCKYILVIGENIDFNNFSKNEKVQSLFENCDEALCYCLDLTNGNILKLKNYSNKTN